MLNKAFLFTLVVGSLVRCCLAGCNGTMSAAALPYFIQYTTTGDSTSTTFVMTVCSSPCQSTANCSPLSSLTVGVSGVTTYPASSASSCGPTWSASALGTLGTQSPSGTEHCESFYMTTSLPNAKVTDVCGGSPCNVRLTLTSGAVASTTVDGNQLFVGGTPLSLSPAPTPYGPAPYGRRLNAYGRRLNAYGRKF